MAAESMSLRDIFTWVFLTLFGGGIFVIYVPKGDAGVVAGLVMMIIGLVGIVVCAWPHFVVHHQKARPALTIGSLAALLWLLPLAAPEFIMHLHQRLDGWVGYLAIGITGAVLACGAWWLYGVLLTPAHASASENNSSPQGQDGKANTQYTEGNNSPNIAGSGNIVIINPSDPRTHEQLKAIESLLKARKQKDDLLVTYPLGYVVFDVDYVSDAVTPYETRAGLERFQFDFRPVRITINTKDHIEIQLPDLIKDKKRMAGVKTGGWKRVGYLGGGGIGDDKGGVGELAEILAIKGSAITFLVGFQKAPEFLKPSLPKQ